MVVSVEDLLNALKISAGKTSVILRLQPVEIEEVEGYGTRTVKIMDLSVVSQTIGNTAISMNTASVALVIHDDMLRQQASPKRRSDLIFQETIASATVRLLIRQLTAAAARSVVAISFSSDKMFVKFFSASDSVPGGMMCVNRMAEDDDSDFTTEESDDEGGDDKKKRGGGAKDPGMEASLEAMQDIVSEMKREKDGAIPAKCPTVPGTEFTLLPASTIVAGVATVKSLLDKMASFSSPDVDLQVYADKRDDLGMLQFSAESEEMGMLAHYIFFRYADTALAFHKSLDDDEVLDSISKSQQGMYNFCIRVNKDVLHEALKSMCSIGSRTISFRFASSALKTDLLQEMDGDERRDADMLFVHTNATVRGEHKGYERFSSSIIIAGVMNGDEDSKKAKGGKKSSK